MKKNLFNPDDPQFAQVNNINRAFSDYRGTYGSLPTLCLVASGAPTLVTLVGEMASSIKHEVVIICLNVLSPNTYYLLELEDMELLINQRRGGLVGVDELEIEKRIPCMGDKNINFKSEFIKIPTDVLAECSESQELSYLRVLRPLDG